MSKPCHLKAHRRAGIWARTASDSGIQITLTARADAASGSASTAANLGWIIGTVGEEGLRWLAILQQAKISALFEIYDGNRDGILDGGDFARVAARIADELRLGADAPERAGLQAQYRKAWDLICGLCRP